MAVILPGIEAENHHAHPREAAFVQQLAHVVGNNAEILRDNWDFAQLLFQRAEQLHTGAFLPYALDRRFFACVNFPEGFKAAEMVETDNVIKLHILLHAPDPPFVAVLFERVPVIDRVAPQLAGFREIVGRHARDLLGREVVFQFEELRVCPYI